MSMFIGGLTFLIGSILNGFAQNVIMLIIGRVFLGIGVGFCNQVLIAYFIGKTYGTTGEGAFSTGAANFVLFLMCAYVAGFAWSWGPLGWLVPSEIFPLETRPAGQVMTVMFNMIFTFVIGQCFLSMLCVMKFGLFIFFSGFVIIMTLFVYFFLPETKGFPIEEMYAVWKAHWFWGKFIADEALGGYAKSETA